MFLSESFSILLNYNLHLVHNPAPGAMAGGSGTVLKTVVELETKTIGESSSYLIDFNSSDNLISLTNLSPSETYRLVVKILPILSYQRPNPIITTGGGAVKV